MLAYPLVIEPFVPLSRQVHLFGYAYAALAVSIAACAIVVVRAPVRVDAAPQHSAPTTWKQRRRWFVFAAIPAAYLTAVTQFITTDLTPAPLLWVVPLAPRTRGLARARVARIVYRSPVVGELGGLS